MARLLFIALLIALAPAARPQQRPSKPPSDYAGLYRDIYAILHRSSDLALRRAAIQDLSARGPVARLAIPALLTELHADGLLADDAIGALAKILTPAEYAALRDRGPELTPQGLEAFVHDFLHAAISVESLPAAEHLLHRKDPGLRALAIDAVLEIARLDPAGVAALNTRRKLALLQIADAADRSTRAPHSRQPLVRLLALVGRGQPWSVRPLVRINLDDTDPATQRYALTTLREFVGAPPPPPPPPPDSPPPIDLPDYRFSNMRLILADILVDATDPPAAALAATLFEEIPNPLHRNYVIAAAVVGALARGDNDVIELIDKWNLSKDDLVSTAVFTLDRAESDDQRHRLLQGLWRAGAHTVAADHPDFCARLGMLLLREDDATLRRDAGQLLPGADRRLAALQALQSMMPQLPPAALRALRAGNGPPVLSPPDARQAAPAPVPPTATVPAPVAAYYLHALQRLRVTKPADSQEALAALNGLKQTARGDLAGARETLQPLLRHRDPAIRATAAQLLNTSEDFAIARAGDALTDLHSDSPTLRATAARQLHALNVLPPRLTQTLIRAVDNRDMATREGLLRALEDAYFNKTDPLASLKTFADAGDAAQKAYARAALRQIADTK